MGEKSPPHDSTTTTDRLVVPYHTAVKMLYEMIGIVRLSLFLSPPPQNPGRRSLALLLLQLPPRRIVMVDPRIILTRECFFLSCIGAARQHSRGERVRPLPPGPKTVICVQQKQEKTETERKTNHRHPFFVPTTNRIVSAAGKKILGSGGVIRALDNWGVFPLPRAHSRKNQPRQYNGHYFVMRYDTSTQTQRDVMQSLRLDQRVIRSTSVKLGDNKLSTMSRFGQIDWTDENWES